MLASGQDLPDIIMSNLSTAMVATSGTQGTFMPLNGLIANSYWYNDVLEKEPSLNGIMKRPGGEQYSMPSVLISMPNSLSERDWVNRNFLECSSVTKVPETTDEFRAMFQAFEDNGANGNGDATDKIPWMGPHNGWQPFGSQWLMNAFLQIRPRQSLLYRGRRDAGRL